MKRTVLFFAFGLLIITSVMAGGKKESASQPDPAPVVPVEHSPVQTNPRPTPAPPVPAEPPLAQTVPSPAPAPAQPSNPFYSGTGGSGSSIARA